MTPLGPVWLYRVVDGEWMELTPDMMAHNKRSVLKWVEKHTEHYRSTGVKFENALDWVTQTRYEKSASEISTRLGLGGSVRWSTRGWLTRAPFPRRSLLAALHLSAARVGLQ
jgi:hypothetical protein